MKKGVTWNGQGKETAFVELNECCYQGAGGGQQKQQSRGDTATAYRCDDSGKEEGKECCDLSFPLPSDSLQISPTE